MVRFQVSTSRRPQQPEEVARTEQQNISCSSVVGRDVLPEVWNLRHSNEGCPAVYSTWWGKVWSLEPGWLGFKCWVCYSLTCDLVKVT